MTPMPPEELGQKLRRDRSRALAQAVVTAFTERLKEEAAKQGGFLSQRHIDELNVEFQTKSEQLTAVFEQALLDATREQEELKWHAIKRPAFDRLMVKRFEHLLLHRGANGIVHGTISRRMLPGFFLALHMMMGPQERERYHWRCDAAVERIMKGRVPVDWNLIDKDEAVHDIVLDAQYSIAMHFEDIARRTDWFINITNSHLAPPAHKDAGDANWELTPPALQGLLQSLLADLGEAVSDDAAWHRLAQRHPDADRNKLALILDHLR
ncbi:hypothetical protein [Magnetovibrio sp.]|uniref:hypothetical protein n=1 Tax=Magnetovibrio sp. TaxID=2024836 RepID=UPI002F929A2D